MKPLADSTGISSVVCVGTILVDFNPINIFDITVSSHVLMNRNRVGIQQLIRRIMPTYSSAFMIFIMRMLIIGIGDSHSVVRHVMKS